MTGYPKSWNPLSVKAVEQGSRAPKFQSDVSQVLTGEFKNQEAAAALLLPTAACSTRAPASSTFPNTRVQQLPNAGVQQLPENLRGGWGRGRAADGEAAAATGAGCDGQREVCGDFVGNRCIVFIFTDSIIFRCPSNMFLQGMAAR
jgi:hypothetical protein